MGICYVMLIGSKWVYKGPQKAASSNVLVPHGSTLKKRAIRGKNARF